MPNIIEQPPKNKTNRSVATYQPFAPLIDRFKIKQRVAKHKLGRAWAFRNTDHGRIFATALELDCVVFQQNIFVEANKELILKLKRIGFEELTGYPDEEVFKDFINVLYDKKNNIAISLYQSQHKVAIETAYKIVENTVDGVSGFAVFISAINVLTKK
jgi:hypothetical protein